MEDNLSIEDNISIYDSIKEGKYEASLITTYNAYLPFYEDVILRRLLSIGCRYNILMMDSSRLSECVQESSTRPHFAGTSYVLLPMKVSGAFHPKIMILVNRRSALLFVGSHNMTLSGFGINRELTTKLLFKGDKDTEGIYLFQQVWAFINNWLELQNNILPDRVIKSLAPFKNFAPWLFKNIDQSDERGIEFIGSNPKGKTLWDSIKDRIRNPVERIFVVGPFFDNELEFVKRIKDDLRPREIIIGVDPDTVELPTKLVNIKNVKFVDASTISTRRGYLHAKAIHLEGENSYLITGSANPSSPAWINESPKNAEAIVLHYGESAISKSKQIGILDIASYPELNKSALELIKSKDRLSPMRKSEHSVPVSVAPSTDTGYILLISKFKPRDFVKAILLDDYDHQIDVINTIHVNENIILPVSQEKQISTRFIKVEFKGNKYILFLAHNSSEIKKRTESTRQAKLRSAFSNLYSDTPDLESLISAVERVVFDEDVDIEPSLRPKGHIKKPEEKKIPTIDTLMGSISSSKRIGKKRRILESGDLATIIDVLIYKLGQGLEKEGSLPINKPSEEEQVGRDDDDSGDNEIKWENIIKTCHRKINTLINRMEKQFQRTAKQKDFYIRPILQLIAVLALIRELRTLDFKLPWIPIGETLVPQDSRQKLYSNALKYLYGQDFKFLEKALEDYEYDTYDEYSKLYGLLLWLSHECGEDCRKTKVFNEKPDITRKRFHERAHMILIAPQIADDDLALEEAKKGIMNCTAVSKIQESARWLDTHKIIGEKINKITQDYIKIIQSGNKCKSIQKPQSGDLAYVLSVANPVTGIITSIDNRYISIADIQTEYASRSFMKEHVCVESFPAIENSVSSN